MPTSVPTFEAVTGTSAGDLRQVDVRRLVNLAVDGDRAAVAELYRRFRPLVLTIQLGNTRGDRALAWDLTQDTFLKALTRLDRLRWQGGDAFRGWLATIARNVFLDHVRAAAQRHHGGYALPDAIDPLAVDDPAALAERDLDGVRDFTGRLLGRLSPDHRHVLQRLLAEGASVAEVATELERSPAAVQQLRRRAIVAARRESALVGA